MPLQPDKRQAKRADDDRRAPGHAPEKRWTVPELPLPTLVSMGRSIFDPIWAIEDHVNQNAELMLVLRGKVTVHTADYDIPAAEGEVIYTPAGKMHRDIFPLDSEFEVYLVHVQWGGEAAMLKEASPLELNHASRSDGGVIAAEMRQLYADFLRAGPMSSLLTSLRLMQIILRLWQRVIESKGMVQQDTHDFGKARRVEIMRQARHVIHEQFDRPLGLDDIAQTIGISPYYLSRVFSQEAGFTLSNYLLGVRLEEAVEMLKNSGLKVGDIAHRVGFRDAHYFAKVFRNHFGASPSAYRAKLMAKGG